MIEVSDLSYEYPTVRALNGVSLRVIPQTITALVGPNGAGKTTLLRCLAALDAPYDGHVLIDGLDTATSPREIHARLGYLPDFYGLYDELSVRRCLTYAARAHGMAPSAAGAAAEKAAARVGLSDRMESPAGELSRGLRQRLAIGQTIVHEPRVLLLDEPAAGLDLGGREDLVARLGLLAQDTEAPALVLVTHHVEEIPPGFTDVLLLRDGRIVAAGPLELTLTAENLSATFGLPLVVERHGDRWSARAATPAPAASAPAPLPG